MDKSIEMLCCTEPLFICFALSCILYTLQSCTILYSSSLDHTYTIMLRYVPVAKYNARSASFFHVNNFELKDTRYTIDAPCPDACHSWPRDVCIWHLFGPAALPFSNHYRHRDKSSPFCDLHVWLLTSLLQFLPFFECPSAD